MELFETLNILVFFLGLGSVSLIRFHLREDSVLIELVKLLIAYFLLRKGRCYVHGCFYHI